MAVAVRGQLIPLSDLAPGEPNAIRAMAEDYVRAEAAKQMKIDESELVIRDIDPAVDLDYTYKDWNETTGATADAWETMSTGTMDDDRFVAIYGVKDDVDAPSCSALKFNIGGGDKNICTLQQLRPEDDMVGYFPFPIIIPQNTSYTIYRWVRSASSPTHIVLKGITVEKRGKVLSP